MPILLPLAFWTFRNMYHCSNMLYTCILAGLWTPLQQAVEVIRAQSLVQRTCPTTLWIIRAEASGRKLNVISSKEMQRGMRKQRGKDRGKTQYHYISECSDWLLDVLGVWGRIGGKIPRQVRSNVSRSAFPDLYNWGTNTGAVILPLGICLHDWTKFKYRLNFYSILEKCKRLFTKWNFME